MMKMIGINEVAFVGALVSMRRAANQINTTTEGWDSMGEQSSVFEEYLEQYAQLQAVLLSYQNLILKDIDAISKIGVSMLKVDELLTNLWK